MQNQKTITIDSFRGLDNVTPPEKTSSKFLKVADNVDITADGQIRKREGYTKVVDGDFNSLWSDGNYIYCIKDNNLVRLDQNYTEEILLSNVTSTKTYFEEIDGKIYFSNENGNGIVDNGSIRNWGIPRPNGFPALSYNGSGSLSPGEYQVNLTYVASDGRESGCGVAMVYNLASPGAITLSNIPQSSDNTVSIIRIYCSTCNGDMLYWIRDIAHGTTSTTIDSVEDTILPLNTFNINPAPKGTLIKYFSGRIYIVDKNVLWYSMPFSYEWFNFQSDFIQFTENETILSLMPVEDGMYVATTIGLYYLRGRDPMKWRADLKERVLIIPGTEQYIQGALIQMQNTPPGYKWVVSTDHGIYALFQDGLVINLTYRNVSLPRSDEGASVFMEHEGLSKYVSSIRKPERTNSIGATDLVTATVIRNGIVVPA